MTRPAALSRFRTRFTTAALLTAVLGAGVAVAQTGGQVDPPPAAAAPDAEAVARYTQLLQAVQSDPSGTSQADAMELMQLGETLGRSFAVNIAMKGYLSLNPRPDAELLSHAARHAVLAGDYRTAAARYKSYLAIAGDTEDASRIAGLLDVLLVDLLQAEDEAYVTLSAERGSDRKTILPRKYEPWYIAEALDRSEEADAAAMLAVALGSDYSQPQVRLHYLPLTHRLLDRLSEAGEADFDAAGPLKQLAPLLKSDERLAKRADFYAANLAFYAAAAGKGEEALASDFKNVAAAASTYLDADSTAETARDIMATFMGGLGRDVVKDRWEIARSQKEAFFITAFDRLSDDERAALLPWRAGLVTDGRGWAQIAGEHADFFTGRSVTREIPFTFAGDIKAIESQSKILSGVASDPAAVMNSLAAANGSDAAAFNRAIDHLFDNELYHVDMTAADRLFSEAMWDAMRAMAGEKGLADDVKRAAWLRYGREVLTQTPAAVFDPDAVEDYLDEAWQAARDSDDPAVFVKALESLAWVPYTDRQRGEVYRDVRRSFDNWRGYINREIKKGDKGDNISAKVKDALDPIDRALTAAIDRKEPDLSAAPNDTARAAAELMLAIRSNDSQAYNDAGRRLLDDVKGYRDKPVPFGQSILLELVRHRDNIGTIELQAAVLDDQLAYWSASDDPGAHNAHIAALVDEAVDGRNNWGLFDIDRPYEEQAKRLAGVFQKHTMARLERGEFSPQLFDWFRGTRIGDRWGDRDLGVEVMDRIVEKRMLDDHPGYRPKDARSATATYMELIDDEFPSLKKKYPLGTYFDDMFVEEAKRTRHLDARYLQLDRSEDNQKVLNAAAEVLATFDTLPFDEDGPRYAPAEFWEWHARAMAAEEKLREALLKHLESTYGESRVDPWAMGEVRFYNVGELSDGAGRAAFFKNIDQYVQRSASQPARVDLPPLGPLASIDPSTLTRAELDTLLAIFPDATPAKWRGGQGYESLARLVGEGLLAQGRGGDLSRVVPHLWAIARDTGDGDLQRSLLNLAKRVTSDAADESQAELGMVVSSAGLELMGSALAEDTRTTLSTLRNKALSGVGQVVPVRRSDPRYPIFASQASFLTGREQAAWQGYLDHRALAMSMYKDLDPSYVIWLIQKNTQAADFDAANELAEAMILWVSSVDDGFSPETRARLLLAHADIALAKKEYARGRALFERVAAADEFAGTLAGAEAELKVADVDRLTGRYDSAITILEDVARRRNAPLQAEAYYGLAKVYFDQNQIADAREALDKVFLRDPESPQARILEGRVNLAVKNIENASDLAIGNVTLQRLLIPGKPLRISLEDRNLAVVGEQTDIQVRAWTDSGDEETFSLLPFGDSQTRFRGEIATRLAPAQRDDGTLQVLGQDRVHYDYSQSFKAAQGVEFDTPPSLTVASDAGMYASSGEILTPAELERIRLERQIRQRLGTADTTGGEESEDVSLSSVRASTQIKPGNPINIRVIDPDRSTTDDADTLTVQVRAASGDVIASLPLTETGTHSGVFEGEAPTRSGQPIAYASDSQDGREPNFAISKNADYPAWSGIANGVSPKTYTVDLNDNVNLGTLTLTAAEPGQRLEKFRVQRSFNGTEFETLGVWPGDFQTWDGSPKVEIAAAPSFKALPDNATAVTRYWGDGRAEDESPITTASINTITGEAVTPAMIGDLAGEDDGFYIAKYSAAFSQPRRELRTLQLQKLNEEGAAINMFLTVDGQGGGRRYTGSLRSGVHLVNVWVVARKGVEPRFNLLWNQGETEGDLTPISPDALSVEKNPEIKAALYLPPATITASENNTQFQIAFDPTTNARVLRLVLEEFETDAPAINKIALTDAAGEVVLPTSQDFLELRQNSTLEIVPGDRVTVSYEDPLVVSPGEELHEQTLTATYSNGNIYAAFGRFDTDDKGVRSERYVPMRRFAPGDTVYVFINDPDLDTSAKLDTAAFRVETYGGEAATYEAVETAPHSGTFVGKVWPVTGEPTKEGEVTISEGDQITLTYRDAENTDPGVPFDRISRIEQVRYRPPQVRVFDITSQPLADASASGTGTNTGTRARARHAP